MVDTLLGRGVCASARLTLFFLLIVIVPMVSVAVILFRLIADNEQGKADARVAQGETAAIGLYKREVERSGAVGARVAPTGRSPRRCARATLLRLGRARGSCCARWGSVASP